MDEGRDRVEAALVAIEPWDDLETTNRDDALAWVRRGAPIWRTAKPATPPKHLCSYAFIVDVPTRSCLLVDHLLARLWLPPGGHVEPGEDPSATARREANEELGIHAPPLEGIESPLLVTQTTTGGADAGHCDVSLWYACRVDSSQSLRPDLTEFAAVRWWTFDDLRRADPGRFEPHLRRFLDKLLARLAHRHGDRPDSDPQLPSPFPAS